MFSHRPPSHWLLLAALVVMWGSSFMFNKIAVSSLAPVHVVTGRLGLAALLLLGLFALSRRRVPTSPRLWMYLAVIAVVGNCVPFWLISWGQQRIDSGVAGILMAIMPLTTVALAHFFVAGERLSAAKVAGFLLGFCGIVVLMGPELLLELRGSGTALVSELSVLGGAVCYAVASIIARRRPESDALVATAGVTVIATLLMVPVVGASEPLPSPGALPASALWAMAFLGFVSTASATIVYFKLITLAGPSFLSQINYLIPLWAVFVGVIFLGESPQWTALAGLALVLSGIALSELQGRRAVRSARPPALEPCGAAVPNPAPPPRNPPAEPASNDP